MAGFWVNKHLDNTKKPFNKVFAGFWGNKHPDSAEKSFIKLLAGFCLISTAIVLWYESLNPKLLFGAMLSNKWQFVT